MYPALRLVVQATAWECSHGRSLCLTKSSACGRLWQFAHPRLHWQEDSLPSEPPGESTKSNLFELTDSSVISPQKTP